MIKLNIFNINFLINKIIITRNKVFVLKKITNIVYKLNNINKKILFLGINKKYYGLLKFIKLKTKHCFIIDYFWLNGLLSNILVVKYSNILSKLNYIINLKLRYNFNLILILNNFKIKKEIIKSNILTILFNQSNKFFNYNTCNKIKNYLFLVLIYLIIKKT